MGTSSSKEDGLFLANLLAGAHIIRVEKDGFVPQSFQVKVLKLPTEVKVGEFSPEPLIRNDKETSSAKVNQPIGNLLITSVPHNCVVEIDGKAEIKSAPLLLIEGLAPGEHPIAFSKPGYDQISGVVRIQPGGEVTVRGDLKAGKVGPIYQGKGWLRVISTPKY